MNTSVSALDSPGEIQYRVGQYERLKKHCGKSVLRVVSCKFNLDNHEGQERNHYQAQLFMHDNVLDTVFRPSAENEYLKRGVILAEKRKFLGTVGLASTFNKGTYFGDCKNCPDMCGVSL